jgi:NADPH:quinone reductase-like Zn-dependent oxidoreductase
MARLIAMHDAGACRPIVGARFPFNDITIAHAAADSGHKRGNIVIEMANGASALR